VDLYNNRLFGTIFGLAIGGTSIVLGYFFAGGPIGALLIGVLVGLSAVVVTNLPRWLRRWRSGRWDGNEE